MNAIVRVFLIITILFSTTFFTKQALASYPISTSSLLEQEPLRFIIYYSGDVSTIMNDDDSYLKTFMAIYKLELINTFEIDELNKGFTLQAREKIEMSNEVAKELSLIDNVLMIEIVNPSMTSET